MNETTLDRPQEDSPLLKALKDRAKRELAWTLGVVNEYKSLPENQRDDYLGTLTRVAIGFLLDRYSSEDVKGYFEEIVDVGVRVRDKAIAEQGGVGQ